ncbi:MAG: site-specific integrase [bacterium]|nr:site-specific integrase [bacterium]
MRRKLYTQHNNFRHSPDSKKDSDLKYLHDLFIKYKLHGARNAQATIRDYRQAFELLLKFDCELKLKDLTENTIINFFEFLDTRERQIGTQKLVRTIKNSSVASLRSKLNSFFVWLNERHYIKANPFDKIPFPKVTYTDRRAFSPKEFEAICYAINTRIDWQNLLIKKRNIAVIMFLVLTGVRKKELLGLHLSDIDIDRKLIHVPGEISKSKRTRIIPMNATLILYLTDYLSYRQHYTTNFLWISSTQDRGFTEHGTKHLVHLLSKVTKINCHLHRFRHTFAINYYTQTHDLIGLQKLMGHTSFKMTLRYMRSLPDEYVVDQMQKITIDEFI